jgi:hypothetical protein
MGRRRSQFRCRGETPRPCERVSGPNRAQEYIACLAHDHLDVVWDYQELSSTRSGYWSARTRGSGASRRPAVIHMKTIAPFDPSSPDSSLYLKQMSEVRDRLNAVIWLAYSEQVFQRSHHYVVESMFLQLRKVLELIAFGSLTANKAKYASAYAEFAKHWNAKKLLKALGAVNPQFYPTPVKLIKVPAKGEAARYEILKDGFLTQDEFVFLYEISSKVIHTRNPFTASNALEIKYDIPVWVERIRQLLRIHIMHFVDDRRWLVYAPETGKHGVYTVLGDRNIK